MPIAQTSQLGLIRLGQMQLGRVTTSNIVLDVVVSRTAQLGLIELAQMQLGFVDPEASENSSIITAPAATLAASGTVSTGGASSLRLLLLGIG
jgi:hypothetical protein